MYGLNQSFQYLPFVWLQGYDRPHRAFNSWSHPAGKEITQELSWRDMVAVRNEAHRLIHAQIFK